MGKVLAGRYELLKQVAAGGMATVHLARALGVGGFERLVAVKVMHPHIGAETEFVTMFLDEARLAARIRHPNVVPTLDVQESPDGLFLVMEYIEGPSLHQLMKAAGKTPGSLPLGIVLRVMLDTLAGLHAAHELADDEGAILSLVHRDVTPVNILIGTDGVARITCAPVGRSHENHPPRSPEHGRADRRRKRAARQDACLLLGRLAGEFHPGAEHHGHLV